MKFFFSIILVALTFLSFAQLSPNLLARDEKTVKQAAAKIGLRSEKKTYSDIGNPILSYDTDVKLTSMLNSMGNSMAYAFFKWELKDICTTCKYYYLNNDELEIIVDRLESDTSFVKNPFAFSWKHKKYDYAIDKEKNNTGFFLIYNWIFLPRK